MPNNVYLQLALPVPLWEVFDYLPPKEHAKLPLIPGVRVQVPFGNRTLTGILLQTTSTTSVDRTRIKHANSVLDKTPIISHDLLELVVWAAKYYQSPIGEAIQAALPVLLRQGHPATYTKPQTTILRLTHEGQGLPTNALKNAPKQAAIIAALQAQGVLTQKEILLLNFTRDAVKRLLTKQLVVETTEPLTPALTILEKPLTLNPEQHKAFQALDFSHFQVSLLDGTTGSGKTEVYLQVIAKIFNQNRNAQALVLIPEIGLTPQTLTRFTQRFGDVVAALHSGLSDKGRLDAWVRASTGDAKIIIGTRSSIFTPFKKLAIIIVDEEHDASFKQQDGFRYSARDLAVVRAKKLNIPLILGSATPSLESLHNAREQRYQQLSLKKQAGSTHSTTIKMIDLQQTESSNGFATESIDAINHHINLGNQVLIFLNRRGFAPTLQCDDCGWIAECPHCDARLTLHQNPKHLRCHHCDHQRSVYSRCDACRSSRLHPQGQGTERSEQTLQERFPHTPILRIDRDSTQKKNALLSMLKHIATGDPCILIGTQMLAKGHHFPDVTLVVILDADSGLFSADFRGPERMGQLLTQVSGRAGRAQKAGEVLLQSHYTQHPLLQTLVRQGYHSFAELILKERAMTQLPPYSHMALLRADALLPSQANAFLTMARQHIQHLSTDMNILMLGPLPALMEKRGRRFRFLLQFTSPSRSALRYLADALVTMLKTKKHDRQLRWSIDIDPQDMS